MSELINTRSRSDIRLSLLATVSAVSLLAAMGSQAHAEDADHPTLWVELGGAFDFVDGSSEPWIPVNLPPVIDHPVAGILGKFPDIGYDASAKLTLQPGGTDWTFSASVRYGKSKRGPKLGHDQSYRTSYQTGKYQLTTYAFTNLHDIKETKHTIIDFQAGKDIGVGLFGGHGSSTLNFGIRLAEFTEKADATMAAQTAVPGRGLLGTVLDAEMNAARSFSGIGPSVALNGSNPLTGTLENGLAFDWGVNGAILFGRQKARVRTHTENRYYTGGYTYYYSANGGLVFDYSTAIRTNVPRDNSRRRNVVVPNVGAFAGISYRLGGRGKIALGYRADFFFGAMDGGIDTRHSENVAFHGPFATISLGLGG
jgi:hypothetical protein